MCVQEVHDQCECVRPIQVVERDGCFVYVPYVFDVSEETLKSLDWREGVEGAGWGSKLIDGSERKT